MCTLSYPLDCYCHEVEVLAYFVKNTLIEFDIVAAAKHVLRIFVE